MQIQSGFIRWIQDIVLPCAEFWPAVNISSFSSEYFPLLTHNPPFFLFHVVPNSRDEIDWVFLTVSFFSLSHFQYQLPYEHIFLFWLLLPSEVPKYSTWGALGAYATHTFYTAYTDSTAYTACNCTMYEHTILLWLLGSLGVGECCSRWA